MDDPETIRFPEPEAPRLAVELWTDYAQKVQDQQAKTILNVLWEMEDEGILDPEGILCEYLDANDLTEDFRKHLEENYGPL